MKAMFSPETLAITTSLHGVTTEKTTVNIFNPMRTSKLKSAA
jgi:hypothetical protein